MVIMMAIKVKISTKENMANISLPDMPEFIPLEVIRGKDGKVKGSEGEAFIDERDLERFQELGKKYGFSIKKL